MFACFCQHQSGIWLAAKSVEGGGTALMRIKILQTPTHSSVDGIDLDRFIPDHLYEVGNSLAALLLAEGWAEPVSLDEPAEVVPFSETDPFTQRWLDDKEPPNLVRDYAPPTAEQLGIAADYFWRPRKRR